MEESGLLPTVTVGYPTSPVKSSVNTWTGASICTWPGNTVADIYSTNDLLSTSVFVQHEERLHVTWRPDSTRALPRRSALLTKLTITLERLMLYSL